MNQEIIGKLMDQWTSDAAFRAAVRTDPLAAMERMGLQLSDDEKAAVKGVDWSLSDDELLSRTSHVA